MPAAGPLASGYGVTRRTFIVSTAAGAVLVACGDGGSPRTGSNPDAAAIAHALAAERALLAGYDALPVAAEATDMRPRDAHAEHLTALLALLREEPTPSGTASTAPAPSAHGRVGLRQAERASAGILQDAATTAAGGTTAAVLASIAASHAALGVSR